VEGQQEEMMNLEDLFSAVVKNEVFKLTASMAETDWKLLRRCPECKLRTVHVAIPLTTPHLETEPPPRVDTFHIVCQDCGHDFVATKVQTDMMLARSRSAIASMFRQNGHKGIRPVPNSEKTRKTWQREGAKGGGGRGFQKITPNRRR
jgi:hypothetical protein